MEHSFFIRDYRDGDRPGFEACNRWWLEKWYAVEAIDQAIFDDPRATILEKGGRIFVAEDRTSGEVLGVVALIASGLPGHAELAKMGVLECAQGRGIGRALVRYAIEESRKAEWVRIYLYSSAALGPALALYAALGFRHLEVTDEDRARYRRCSVKMELPLTRPQESAA